MRQRDRQPRVTVRRGFGDKVGPQIGVGTRLVVDKNSSLHCLGQLLPNQTGHHVGEAAGGKGHHVANGFTGVVSGQGRS